METAKASAINFIPLVGSSAHVASLPRPIIHLKGYALRTLLDVRATPPPPLGFDLAEEHRCAEALAVAALEAIVAAGARTVVWDGDVYAPESFTSLLPRLADALPELTFCAFLYESCRTLFLDSWSAHGLAGLTVVTVPDPAVAATDIEGFAALGVTALRTTGAACAVCLGGGPTVVEEHRASRALAPAPSFLVAPVRRWIPRRSSAGAAGVPPLQLETSGLPGRDGVTLLPPSAPPAAPEAGAAPGETAGGAPSGVVVLASLTPSTGNRVTADRIAAALGATTLSVTSAADPAALGAALGARGARLVVGVHAYRAGRLLLGCGVPFVLVLGGTDMNVHLHEETKRPTIVAAVEAAIAVVAFNAELLDLLLRAVPAARPKAHLVPQAVASPLFTPAPAAPEPAVAPRYQSSFGSARAATADERRAVRGALRLSEGETLLLLPAGVRPVKDVLFLAEAVAAWRARQDAHYGARDGLGGRVCLRLVGPCLDEEYAASVGSALAALEPGGAVQYVGPLPREQLHLAMGEAAVLLNSSVSEGECNSILEAMLLGVPVVARANTGNASLLTHGETGMLYETAEEAVLAVRAVLGSEPGLAARLASAASEAVHRGHSAEREAQVYAEVLAAARAAGCGA